MSNGTQDIPRFQLAPQQEQLFLLPGDAAVTQAVVFLADRVSEADLRAALDGLVSRHEILRTTFASIAGMRVPTQLIRDDLPAAWSSSVLAGDERVDVLLDSLLRDEEAALDAKQGPILRAVLTVLPDSRQALVLTAPAACLDAKSMILLLRELGEAAGGYDVAEDPLQYADYAEWRRQLVDADAPDAEAARSWWQQQSAQRPLQLLFGRVDAE